MGNPYHDAKGRFASSGAAGPGQAKAEAKRAEKAKIVKNFGGGAVAGAMDWKKLDREAGKKKASTIFTPDDPAPVVKAVSQRLGTVSIPPSDPSPKRASRAAERAARGAETYSQREERYRREWAETKKKAGGVRGFAALRPGDTPWSRFEGVRY